MRLTLAVHTITDVSFGPRTHLEGSRLQIDVEELRRCLLADSRLQSVDLELALPGESVRVGYVFDILEPRAKEAGSGPDFPGILGPVAPVGQGTTHVLRGAAVTVVDGGQPSGEHGYASRRGGMSKALEMIGEAAKRSPYSEMRHLVIVPHAHPDVERHAVLNALRVASCRAAVFMARAAVGQPPDDADIFDLGISKTYENNPPRVVYIGQIHGHQHGTESDEHILYGSNTRGMMPTLMHPNEWLDGAVVISYSWGARGLETYFYQNHPIIKELYRLHRTGEMNFVGVIATTSSDQETEMKRNSMMAAQIAKWSLGADGVILTKYVGGAPHTDMFETARSCETLGLKTVVMTSDTATDGRAESALLINTREVDAIVSHSEGSDVQFQLPKVERIIAGNPEVANALADLAQLTPAEVCGVANNQGASRLQPVIY
ncbi:MAG: glycine/sarcosine/betaine reductase component B subunit [SAR202 cluster bacterium]|nr:glycine/sarcosine/betaine reductase component B subunit [SAR202 cluster bacterium]